MKHHHTHHHTPDASSVESELTFYDSWDPEAVSQLIRSKCSLGEMPAFLFVGRKEASLLRGHLAKAFGAESVSTLRDSYYMGLEVVEIDSDSFVFVGGRKATRTLQDPIARRPAWRDRETNALWQFRLG